MADGEADHSTCIEHGLKNSNGQIYHDEARKIIQVLSGRGGMVKCARRKGCIGLDLGRLKKNLQKKKPASTISSTTPPPPQTLRDDHHNKPCTPSSATLQTSVPNKLLYAQTTLQIESK